VRAFFHGNRYLLRDLVAHVVGQLEPEDGVVDLYAGVGLFAIAAAAVRGARVTAVEGDRVAAQDLEANVRHSGRAVDSVCEPVEVFAARARVRPGAIVLDPPRTGVSRAALEGAVNLGARQIVYVSCDVATLARDSRFLVDAGYAIQRVAAFDLFPNTPHIETVVVFGR
jgi:23S rRNA (uracil1939-C5)-methyltransferase